MTVKTAENVIALQHGDPAPPVVMGNSTTAMIHDEATLNKMVAFANIMATSRITIPKHLQGSPGDCLAITMQAMQWGMNPFAVAQKTHTVNGALGYEAQLVASVINTRAPIVGRLNYEWFGDWSRIAGRFKEVPAKNPDEKRIVRDWTLNDEKGLGVKVWATMRGESEPRVLELLLSQAAVRNSPLWGQDPKQQLAYLATKRWSRLHCPDVILGVYTEDETDSLPRDVTPVTRAASAIERIKQSKQEQSPAEQPDTTAMDACLDAIARCGTLDELKTAAKAFPVSLTETQQATVKAAYAERKTCILRNDADVHAEQASEPQDSLAQFDAELNSEG